MLSFDKTPKRYLVTGGCGFIGSHVVDRLIAKGHSVVVLDDLSTGKKENMHPKASLIIGNTTHEQTVEQAMENVDGCFHLAAIASVEKSVKEWAATHTVNVLSTINVFQAASRHLPKLPIVYTSSAAVYGDCRVVPTAEAMGACPLTAYGADKFACDLQGQVAWLVHDVRNTGLRPFNVYGPRQDPGSPYSGVISIFMDRIQRGMPVTIYGDGEQVRDFVYVHDAAKAFVAAMEDLHDSQQHPGHDVMNLCTGHATSINELVRIIAIITDCLPRCLHAASRKGDIRASLGDAGWLASRLGIKPSTRLREGLQFMVNAHSGNETARSLSMAS